VSTLAAVGPGDIPVLAALHAESFPDEPWGEAAIAEILAMPGAFGFLADADAGAPAGFLLALDLGAECEVLALGVRPALRRRGLGRQLVAQVLAVAAGRAVHLEVAEDNAAALPLYLSAGFRVVGRRADYYRRRDGAAAAAVLLRHGAPA